MKVKINREHKTQPGESGCHTSLPSGQCRGSKLKSSVGGCGDVQARPTQDMRVPGSIPARDPVRVPVRVPVGACLPRGPSTDAMLYAVPATLNKLVVWFSQEAFIKLKPFRLEAAKISGVRGLHLSAGEFRGSWLLPSARDARVDRSQPRAQLGTHGKRSQPALDFLTAETIRLSRRFETCGQKGFSISKSGKIETSAWVERGFHKNSA